MNNNFGTIEQKFAFISRRIFLSVFVFGILSWATSEVTLFLKSEWIGLVIIFRMLFLLGALALAISWITPGLLIFSGNPKLVHAWLRGINPLIIPKMPWEELSNSERLFVIINAIALTGAALFAIVGFTLYYIQG